MFYFILTLVFIIWTFLMLLFVLVLWNVSALLLQVNDFSYSFTIKPDNVVVNVSYFITNLQYTPVNETTSIIFLKINGILISSIDFFNMSPYANHSLKLPNYYYKIALTIQILKEGYRSLNNFTTVIYLEKNS